MALVQLVYIVLAVFLAWVAIFDLCRRRVPNFVSFALLFSGLLLNGVSAAAVIFPVIAGLYLAWRSGGMGGGDAKLWMAMMCFAPVGYALEAVAAMGLVWMATGLVQLAFRRLRRRPLWRLRSPGAWRVVPYAMWLVWVA